MNERQNRRGSTPPELVFAYRAVAMIDAVPER